MITRAEPEPGSRPGRTKVQAWINGEFKSADEASVPLLSFSLARGLMIFEVLSSHPSDKGPACLALEQHMDRFFRSAELLKMKLPYTKQELMDAVVACGRENGVSEIGAAKWFAYYPGVGLSALPSDDRVEVAVFFDEYSRLGLDQEALSAPVDSGISGYRKCDPRSVPIHAKVCGNYVNAYLAKMEALEKGHNDALLLGVDDYIAEGPTHNTFFVRDGRIFTPPLQQVLKGTTRGFTIDLMEDMGFEVIETKIRPGELPEIEEIFNTSCLVKLQPVRSIDGVPVGETCPGPVTTRIKDRIWEFLGSPSGELEKRYLTYL